MPKINDLNLKKWKEYQIAIFGDVYKIKKTYDIDDSGIGIYGYDIYNENNKFLCYFIGDRINKLRRDIKIIFYKKYANCSK